MRVFDILASEYGWTIPEMLQVPFAVLEDLLHAIAGRYGAGEERENERKPLEVDPADSSARAIFEKLLGLGKGIKVVS